MLRAVNAIDPAALGRLQVVTRCETLEDVLRWGGTIVDVVVQDEYTHDVICATGAHYVVFDTT